MSGPMTAGYAVGAVAVQVAAAAIRAARAIEEGRDRADALRGEHERAHEARLKAMSAAGEQGAEALRESAAQAEQRFERLVAAAERLGLAAQLKAIVPEKKPDVDPADLALHVRALTALSDNLQAILLTESARLMKDAGEAEFDALQGYAPDAARTARWTGRIAHLGPLPEDIAGIARELDACLPGERAELLATELRRRVQLHAEAAQEKAVQEATSVVVEQSLKDLGYQVEAIAETLFVDGGVVHFRRGGWGKYMVRMRVDPKAATLNFNVIRAVKEGENERSVLDHLAEDRWCAEFPALLKALEASGVTLTVTRRLEAGELPVQLVNEDKLPAFKDEDTPVASAKPKAREIK